VSFVPRIVVVGDGVAAWLAAFALAQRLGARGSVQVVPIGYGSHGLGPFGNGLVGLPEWQLTAMAQALPAGLLQRHAAMNPVLGIAYSGWGPGGAPWFLPFGECGAPIGSVPFTQLAIRGRLAGRRVRLADFSLAALAAQAERFDLPAADPRSPRSTLAFAAHLEADGLAAVLKAAALRLGVVESAAPLEGAVEAPHGVSALRLADGVSLPGDLFVDACGALRRGAGWESWGALFPCDAALCRVETAPTPAPYALMTATEAGWTASVPVAGFRHETMLLATGGGSLPDGAARFVPGMARKPWRGNVVAIGAAALLLEPLLGTGLLSTTTAVERLAGLLPHAPESRVEAAEYNRLTRLEAEGLRDMLLAFWRTNGRVGEPLWDKARAEPVPEELARKLSLYAARGVMPIEDGELFEAADWAMLLDGQGMQPHRCSPMAGAIEMAAIDAHLARLRERLIADLRQMPPHSAFLPAATGP
jgi:tryptophan halogenase